MSKLEGVPAPSGDAGVEAVRCGARGESCCSEPTPACSGELECDATSSLCVRPPTRLCAGDEECLEGQVCCLAGLLGRCSTGPRQECPELDLAISTPVIEPFAPLLDRAEGIGIELDPCAPERGCLGGVGARRLLRFSAEVSNVGAADLLLGDPARTPGFTTSSCDGRPYLESFVRYQLFDANGSLRAESRVPALCQPPPSETDFSAPFSCEFLGLWSGFSQTYSAEILIPELSGMGVIYYRERACQWLDVTDLPPGDYVLRTTVDPEGLLQERNLANNTPPDLTVVIPTLGDPTVSCGTPPNPLFGVDYNRECGWELAGFLREQEVTTCPPGEFVPFACGDCGSIRVCDGDTPCSYSDSLYYAQGCFDVSFLPGSEAFPCPDSGRYSIWILRSESDTSFDCTLISTPPAASEETPPADAEPVPAPLSSSDAAP